MNRIQVLEKVMAAKTRSLESNTREAFARDAAGMSVAAVSPKAVTWCSIGALEKELDIPNTDLHFLCPILSPINKEVLVEANDKAQDSLESEWNVIIARVEAWALQNPQEERVLPSYCCQSYTKAMGYAVWNEPQADEAEES